MSYRRYSLFLFSFPLYLPTPPPPRPTLFPYTTLFRSLCGDVDLGLTVQVVATGHGGGGPPLVRARDRKSTRLNSSHVAISYAVFCLKKKNSKNYRRT